MIKWNLDALYKSYESEEFKNDLKTVESLIESANIFAEKEFVNVEDAGRKILEFINVTGEIRTKLLRLSAFSRLNLSVNATDEESLRHMNYMQGLFSKTTPYATKFSKWLPTVKNLDEVVKENKFLGEYKFYLQEIIEESNYTLSEKEEIVISKLTQTGSSAWSRLQGLLTSILEVDYDGKIITLSEVRNLASDSSAEVRRKAYDAELAAYKKIDQSIAYALNGVKGEVNSLVELRGFESALDQAVISSRLQRKTLDALIDTMKEYLPEFRKYLKRKAKLLGHENGLPFYDLFAPVGTSSKKFSEKEAIDYIVKNFRTFDDELANMAQKAFDDEWIDFTPRAGKRGGAFCSNLHPIKQSRILTNFSGSFGNVITLAHELGHAYHGEQIFKEKIQNASYTMPVAETASTFCETIVKNAAIRDADTEEKIFILEQSLRGSTQVIVDILSRFIFEEEVFDRRKNTILNPKTLNDMMISAQKETYGDGLDEKFLHPYMWVNKGHYYMGGLSFYNFPYAFGLLFAKGIYAQFMEKGKAFVPKVNTLLRMTGQMKVEDVAKLIDVDVSSKEFWKKSLDVIKEEIDLFIKLTD